MVVVHRGDLLASASSPKEAKKGKGGIDDEEGKTDQPDRQPNTHPPTAANPSASCDGDGTDAPRPSHHTKEPEKPTQEREKRV